MRRLPATGPLVAGQSVTLEPETLRHVRVLRLRPGDTVELFDGRGGLGRGVIQDDGSVSIDAVELAPAPSPLVLVQALAKGDKIDTVVRMATEIGVTTIALAQTERAVLDPDPRRMERWKRIAREAARQSEQRWEPTVLAPAPLLEIARGAPAQADRRLLAARGAHVRPATAAIDRWLVIGPEGGLTDDEEAALEGLGFARWTLPTGILRTETAAAVALGALLGG